ncbi:MAG: hypothetical protein LBC18_14075, partial [Opitutaceae bacterium]|nr:hypothetical protein [Opitutaceae bacterium]
MKTHASFNLSAALLACAVVSASAWNTRALAEPSVEIIMDNAITDVNGAGGDSPGVVAAGSWSRSTSTSGFYGVNYWNDATKNINKTVTYTPALPSSGLYEVQMWWPAAGNFCAAAPVDICHSGDTETVTVNQRTNGGKWNTLGIFEFTATGGEFVKIRTDDGAGGTIGCAVIAVAVRCVKVEPLTLIDNALTNVNSNVTPLAPGVSVSSYWANAANASAYGVNYWHDSSKSAAKSVTYTPVLPDHGQYEVQMWWPASADFCDAVPVDIVHSGSTVTVYINQQANGGKWNSLGVFEFARNGAEYVKIRTDNGAGGTLEKRVVADAVRFVEPEAPPPNTAPTITTIADQVIAANTATGALAFTVGDAQTPPAALVVSAASSNPTLLPETGIVLGGSGADRTVTLTPAAGQTGGATVTLTVSDGDLTAQSAFTLTVQSEPPPNTAPTITAIANQVIDANTATGALAFTVGDAQTPPAALVVSAASSNPTLLPETGIVLGGSGADRTVTLTPASGQTGGATVTLTVSDGTLTAQSAFTLTVQTPEPPPPPEPLTLIDNALTNVNSNGTPLAPGVMNGGFWASSTGKSGYYGANYWNDGSKNATKSVTYTPVLP